jgi:translation initiation factor IF-2
MSIRIYELAKKLGKSNKEVLAALAKAGIDGKTHSSTIDEATAEKVAKAFKKPAPAKAKTAVKGAVKAARKKPPAKPAQEVPEKKSPGLKKKPSAKPATEVLEKTAPRLKKKTPAKPAPEVLEKPVTAAVAAAPEPETDEGKMPVMEETPFIEEQAAGRFIGEGEETEEKPQVRPGMKKAFQAIRKIEQRRWQGAPKKRLRGQRYSKVDKQSPSITAPRKKTLKLLEGMSVKEFAELISVKLSDVIKKFMEMGYAPTINQPVDTDAAVLVAEGLGMKLDISPAEEISDVEETAEDISKLVPRPPVVTIMGHVDHGKTSLLDAIRETRVMDSEAGGITQHIGAYKVSFQGKDVICLDTPGHEAFTSMRARGAKVTDIVILVVAADDGVKPQTVEAIDHARAANVPIIVAINKIDKPEADPAKVRAELSERGIVAEEWGGQNIFAEISAKQRTGLENLLELIQLQAEMLELKANPDKPAHGVVIEARLDRGRGTIATLLVQAGTLRVGDVFLSGINYGRVRALLDDNGKRINEATPSEPVEVLGFGSVPAVGDTFGVVDDEKRARQVVMARLYKMKSVEVTKKQRLTLEDLYSRIKEGEIKELNIIIKGDVQGSVEAMKEALTEIVHPEVQVKIIHAAAGGINESDVMLASASNAIIIGFNVRPDVKAAHTAEAEGVDIELYSVIYEAIGDVRKALEGLLEPTLKEKVLGRAEVRKAYFASRLGTIAGCMVVDGTVNRNCDGVRVIRDNVVVFEGKLASVKRFKEDVREVQAGYECGIMVENFNDIKVGDIIENFVVEKVAGKL